MPNASVIRDTGISRICGGSRLPASMSSRIGRRNGMRNRLSAKAAHDASSSEKNTVKTVTMALLISDSPTRLCVKTVTKPSNERDLGSAPSPFEVMSPKLRKATKTTKTSGAIQSSDSGVMTTWKIHEPRLCRRLGMRRTSAIPAAFETSAMISPPLSMRAPGR